MKVIDDFHLPNSAVYLPGLPSVLFSLTSYYNALFWFYWSISSVFTQLPVLLSLLSNNENSLMPQAILQPVFGYSIAWEEYPFSVSTPASMLLMLITLLLYSHLNSSPKFPVLLSIATCMAPSHHKLDMSEMKLFLLCKWLPLQLPCQTASKFLAVKSLQSVNLSYFWLTLLSFHL